MVTSSTMRRWAKSFSYKVTRGSRLQISSPKRAFLETPSSCMDSEYGVRGSCTGWSCSTFLSTQFLLVILSGLCYECVFRFYGQCINTSTLAVDTNAADRFIVSNHPIVST